MQSSRYSMLATSMRMSDAPQTLSSSGSARSVRHSSVCIWTQPVALRSRHGAGRSKRSHRISMAIFAWSPGPRGECSGNIQFPPGKGRAATRLASVHLPRPARPHKPVIWRHIPMQTTTIKHQCAAQHQFCSMPCTGYGTQAACPPLIVLAVLSTQQAPSRS